MCKVCVDAVREFFPDCPDDQFGNFLMSATAYPAAEGAHVRKQLEELKAKGCQTWHDAMAMADAEMHEAMARMPAEELEQAKGVALGVDAQRPPYCYGARRHRA
jgi:hypothetical protein